MVTAQLTKASPARRAVAEDPVTDVSTFVFSDQEIRVAGTPDRPLWAAMDVCNVLEIKNHGNAIGRLDDDEKDDIRLTDSIGRTQAVIGVTESGLYSLVLSSRKPQAKAFKKWITSEVIPAIRRSGSYSIQPPQPEPSGNPELAQLLGNLELARMMGFDLSGDRKIAPSARAKIAEIIGLSPVPVAISRPSAKSVLPGKALVGTDGLGVAPAFRWKAWNGELVPLLELVSSYGYIVYGDTRQQLDDYVARRVAQENKGVRSLLRIHSSKEFFSDSDGVFSVWLYEDCPGLFSIISEFFEQKRA
jgi:hypothetical protein